MGSVKVKKYNNEALVARYNAGEDTLNELYESLAPFHTFKFNKLSIERDDFDYCCHLAFMKSIKDYNAEGGSKFLSFYGHILDNEIKLLYRYNTQPKRSKEGLKFSSLDDIVADGLMIMETIGTEDINFTREESAEILRSITKCLPLMPQSYQEILKLQLKGYKSNEINKHLGKSSSYSTTIANKYKPMLHDYLNPGIEEQMKLFMYYNSIETILNKFQDIKPVTLEIYKDSLTTDTKSIAEKYNFAYGTVSAYIHKAKKYLTKEYSFSDFLF